MSIFTDVKQICKKECSSYQSTLCKCSCDPSNNMALVNSCIGCYDFDRIKNVIDKTKKSADSFLFECCQEAIVFVEFKNQKYYSCFENSGCSAADSLYLYDKFLTKNNIDLYYNLEHTFILVMSSEKNSSFDSTFSRMKNSGIFGVDLVNEEFGFNELMELFEARMKREYADCKIKQYNHFFVVLSDLFDSFIDKYNFCI